MITKKVEIWRNNDFEKISKKLLDSDKIQKKHCGENDDKKGNVSIRKTKVHHHA